MRFFPAYTDEIILNMPATRFFVLNSKITRIQAEEEATAITVTHNSKPQERLQELINRIKDVKYGGKPSSTYVAESLAGEASFEEEKGEIAALRERQKAAAEKLKQERQAWKAKQEQLKQQSG